MIALERFNLACYKRLIGWIDSAEMLMQFGGPAFSFPLTTSQLEKSLSDKKRFAFSVNYWRTNETACTAAAISPKSEGFFSRIFPTTITSAPALQLR